jgi:ribosomal protein L11 methylase PrmA
MQIPNQLYFDDILVKHWIKFDYDVKNQYAKERNFYFFKVEHSIHYTSIVNDEYSDYEKLITTTKQNEHSLERFLNLRDKFDIKKLIENRIVLQWNEKYKKYIVLDGCHRLAIIMDKKLHNNELNLDWFEIKTPRKKSKNKMKKCREIQIKSELVKTTNKISYNGWNNRTSYGYHSYNIDEVNILGQRNPKIRLDTFKRFITFDNKNVLDFGCNVGAMLHHLPEIREGVGFDFDENCINVANNICEIFGYKNQKFFVHDFDKDAYIDLKKKISFKPDIIFLLSLGSWVKSWEDLYSLCLEYDEIYILLEINNNNEGILQLEFFEKKGLTPLLILDNSLDDCTNNNKRKTYLIKK